MNRFVQKLIAGAAAVAIAVTGLLGGAPVAKAADPAQPTDGTITIINNDSATYDHTFEGWRLATLKNVTVTGTGENASINFEIDTTDEFVNVIVEVMSEMTVDGKNVKTEYEADANYNGSVTGTEANPMGYLIDKVFKTGGNATVENTETLWKNSSTALREFATKLSAKTLTSSVADNHKTDFKSGNATTGANECKQGFWFLMDTTADPKGTVNANAIESQSIPMLLATKLVNPTDQDAPDYAGATANLGTVTLKANEPSINKEITKVNKADADSKTKMNARIGDTITYTLTTTIPDYTGYVDGSRVLQLIDTAAHGLKDVTVTKVKVGDTELNEDADADNNGYVLKQDKNRIDPLDNCNKADATVTTVDLAHYVNTNDNIASGATVTVTLTAVVDSDAVIAGVGNPNTVELAYSRTPSGEKHQVPGPTVRVYTYDFSIYKTNMAGDTALSGAQFAIARVDSNAETFMTQDAVTKAWKNLTTAKPAADADGGVFTTSADGKIAMSGLPAGEYHVYEIKAPDGYTSIGLPDFKFTITPTFDTAGTTVTSVAYEKTTNTDGNRVSFGTGETASMAQIKNAKNLTELPMTGDLGIKVFVTVGVLLMAAGAAFALSARMRA
ncbi:prealbumin-like fold domain-containing protein [Collinsella aerofaciens]|uniref:prealbumin-like fold domain-containing protein n=1 Tax=Collinsella aerofaciens TaxID=74426 RepID=UPI00321A37DE